jgi:NAD(P)H-dependent flavin oxidoreductase YrpB (nitropropane dioxygenase family)
MLRELTGALHPIVQGPLGFVGGVELPLACSRAGALGMIAGSTVSPECMRKLIRAMRDGTDAPFGVNVRGDAPDLATRIEVLLEERVRIVSFARAPHRTTVASLKDAGVTTLASVGCARHAERAAALGIDVLIAQGAEGGAHVGTVPTALLLSQVVSAVDVPVVAAGGFHDGRGLVAALAQGACGIVMGTRFLMTADTPLSDAVKQAYLTAPVGSTVVTSKVDGAPLRVLGSEIVETLPEEISPADALRLISAPLMKGRPEPGVLAAGEVVGLLHDLPTCHDLVLRIMTEATETITRLSR